MSKGTKLRNLRAEDEIWNPAVAKAEAEGTNLSAILRDFIAGWVAGDIPTPQSRDTADQ